MTSHENKELTNGTTLLDISERIIYISSYQVHKSDIQRHITPFVVMTSQNTFFVNKQVCKNNFNTNFLSTCG